MDRTIVYKVIDVGDYKSIDEKKRIIWHKISSETKDRMGDIVRIDGLDTANFLKKPAVLYSHDYSGLDPVPVIGAGIGFERRGKFLYAGTRFFDPEKDKLSPKLADLVNDLWFLNRKNLMGWSIGFMPIDKEPLKENGKTVGVDYKRTELLEYSNVLIPANQEAVNDAIKRRLISPVIKEFGRGGFPAVDLVEHRFPEDTLSLSAEDREEIKALFEKYLRGRLQIENQLRRANEILPAEQRTKFYYRFIPESEIREYALQGAYQILRYCRSRLKIPELRIHWIKSVGEKDSHDLIFATPIGGCMGSGAEIYIRADVPVDKIKHAIAHESHHIWFGRTYGKTYPKDDAMWESTAEAFSEICIFDLLEKEREVKKDREFLSVVSMSRR